MACFNLLKPLTAANPEHIRTKNTSALCPKAKPQVLRNGKLIGTGRPEGKGARWGKVTFGFGSLEFLTLKEISLDLDIFESVKIVQCCSYDCISYDSIS